MKKAIKYLICMCMILMCFQINVKGEDIVEKREVLIFNSGWLYSPCDYTNAQLKNFDDSGFEEVCVPHANKILEHHKGEDGRSFLNDIASYRFVSWYRRHFTLGEEYRGKRVRIEFEAVASVAEVYVNGNFIGEHKGAYTPFEFDITDYINFDEDNVLSVRVDSTRRSDVPPEGGSVDYCLFGGIVRDVNMIVTGKNYIRNIFVTTPAVTNEKATVKTEVTACEDTDFAVSIFDKDGNMVATGKDVIEIDAPHLWSVDDPYLYTVRVETECDRVETKIGIRYFEFKENGMMLNGEVIKIMGINRHEQWPWIGRAVPDKLQMRDADMIKEAGFNAVRCSHYPQDISFLNRCDEIGLIVFEEAPGWQHIGNEAWKAVYKENIREMIIRDRNHPSVFSWGVRVNESNDNDALYKETNALARELDPTRPTHGARRQDTYEHSTYYEDIYTAHYIYPENPVHTPFLVTEHSWDCWTNGYGFSWATDEQALAFTKDFADKVNYYFGNDYVAGGFAWSMFDYDNEVNYTRTNNVFYSGLYDIFRLPKMASNLYISQKDPEKYGANIYIANYWDDDSKPLTVKSVSGDIAQGGSGGGGTVEGDKFSVTVMSNCDTVELYINGEKTTVEPYGQYTNMPHPFFVFEGVEYEKGEVTAIGYIDGKEAARYTQRTPEAAEKLTLTPDYETLTADGVDMTQVTVCALDENGTLVPTADNEVTIKISGAGKFIGEEKIKLEGGRCVFIVQSKYLEEGKVECTVSADGITGAECTIEVLEYKDDNAVPFSEGIGSVTPEVIWDKNDTDEIFEYSGSWLYIGQSGCYSNDNHYSDTKGDTVEVNFEGEGIAWYGSVNKNHGIASISIDGGEEIFIDLYAEKRTDNTLLYMSEMLEKGKHTMTVKVTGDKNASATGTYVTADHVKIYESYPVRYTEVALSDDLTEYGGEWVKTDNGYLQNKDSGDCLALYEKEKLHNHSTAACIKTPSSEGDGVGLVIRAEDENNFYLFEFKVVDNNLTHAIWKNQNNTWTALVSGKCDNVKMGENVYIRVDAFAKTLIALISEDGEEWCAVSSCEIDTLDGYTGVRTHSAKGEFSDFSIALEYVEKYEITSAVINNNVIEKINLENYDGEISDGEYVIVAFYNGDELKKSVRVKITGEVLDVDIPIEGEKIKIFVWNGIKPLSLPYVVK